MHGMAAQLDPNVKDDLKTQFVTREGTYRLLTLSEYYSRPNRVGYTSNQSSPSVRVSIVSLPNPSTPPTTQPGSSAIDGINVSTSTNSYQNGPVVNLMHSASTMCTANGGGDANNSNSNGCPQTALAYSGTIDTRLGAGMSMHSIMNSTDQNSMDASQIYGGDRLCFNFGRELYVYAFRGVKRGGDMSKPIDKKFYKGTNPSCHDFNSAVATPTGAPLLVGFTTGQIQLVSPHPGPRESRRLFNEDRLIDKTKVTCLKWLPNSPKLFLASHASGFLYLYNEDLQCTMATPNYQPFKMGDGYTILTCKSKSTRNPLYKWVFNTENSCINEFCFSPCGSNLAIVSQDGFLRVFHYDTMELIGIARSYFGGFLCVCWSPDGKYVVVGGEDDLVTVWSLHEKRVVARGQGHRSWVSVVAFDPYTTSYSNWDSGDFSDDENQLSELFAGTRETRFSNDLTNNGYSDYAGNEKSSTPNQHQKAYSSSFRSEGSSSATASVPVPPDKLAISYRLGSVGQDTQICLWDITEDILRHPISLRQRVNSGNFSDATHMNGSGALLDNDGVKVIRPIAMGNVSNTTQGQELSQQENSPTKDLAMMTENSNSSSSKFSTANCTNSNSLQSSNSNTPPDELTGTVHAVATTNTLTKNIHNTSYNKTAAANSTTSKFPNCISKNTTSSSSFSTSGANLIKISNNSIKPSDSGLSAFNTLTQRLSNFSFLSNSDRKSSERSLDVTSNNRDNQQSTVSRNNRKTMSILKSHNHHPNNNSSGVNDSGNVNNLTVYDRGNGSSSNGGVSIMESNSIVNSFGSLKISGKSLMNSNNSNSLYTTATTTTTHGSSSHSVVTSYDPMKLIGTPACPRFDDCPLLEPLVCKKIAHERLSALIFREDCFLTACQDGFIYTWARPGYTTSVPQHLSPSQTAPGGTVI